jgi:radical SAM superfamily enzyme YgiQ (UPF0313 family)
MHLAVVDRYVMTFAKFRPRKALPILASRGCPFKCAFCSEPLTNPRIRFRSPGNIVDEMQRWQQEQGVSHFHFQDSNLTLNRGQIEGICHEILARGLKISFEGWTRANLVDRQVLSLMKRAGLIRMSYGIESGSPEILKIIHKEVSHADMLKAFRLTAELGIEPACFVMLGLPGETRATAERTIRFVRDIPEILYSNLSIANPYPGTELYQWAREGRYGLRLLTEDFSQYRRYDFSPLAVNDLGPDDLVRLQKLGLLRIHLRPRRMLALLRLMGLPTILPVVLSLVGDAVRRRRT